MNKFLRTGLIALGLALSLNLFATTNANAQVLREILSRMDQYNKALSSFQSNVTMVKWDSTLNASDTSEGKSSYLPKTGKHPMYVRIDWTKPAVEQISVIGDQYELYRPRLNQVIKGKVNKAKNNAAVGGALVFMSMSKAELQANYTVKYLGQEAISGGTQTWHLELIPIKTTSYKSAELWVDGDGLPRQAKVIERNNDTTTVLLQNVTTNQTMSGDIFKLNYPKTAKIVNG